MWKDLGANGDYEPSQDSRHPERALPRAVTQGKCPQGLSPFHSSIQEI